MKKVCSLLTLFFVCLFSTFASNVVTKIGEPLRDLSQIQKGDKILLYCNGPIDPAHKEYGTRNAFIRENADKSLSLSRDFHENKLATSNFIWEVLSYEKENDLTYKISFKSPLGNNMPIFVEDPDKKHGRWPGRTIAPEEGESAIFTLTVAIEGNDSLFYIYDENGIYFNGQSIPKESKNGSTPFVGWNMSGDNSLYKIYKPTVEEKTPYSITMLLQDTEGNEKEENSEVVVNALMGDTIQAPKWQFHTFVNAVDFDNGEAPVEFPYVVDGSEPYLVLSYEIWPYIVVYCKDEATGEIFYSTEGYKAKGNLLKLPTQKELGLGYSLITEGYDDYVITKNDTINLVYRKDGKGVPFETTTVENGQFAPATKWYILTVNENKTLSFDEETNGILCGDVPEITDANLWAFTGDLDNGYKIYNKKAGAGYILWSVEATNGAQLFMIPVEDATEPNTFDLNFNNDGFSFKLHNSSCAYLNDFAGEGLIKYWVNSKGATGVGSKFTFRYYTDEMGVAMKFGPYISYLNAENCVGGWTAEQLADLKKAYAAKDTTACRIAVEALAAADTIAFDIKKCYAIVSAFNAHIVEHPGKTFAMALDVDSTLVWKELDETNPSFQFGFRAVGDTANYIVALERNLPIGSYRWAQKAKGVEWGGLRNEDGTFDEGVAAPFQAKKSECAPAAYQFVHQYSNNVVTICAFSDVEGAPSVKAADVLATEGYISTYNSKDAGCKAYWRLKVLGDWNGVDETVIVAPGVQKEVIYDLSGRRVQKAVKGLYIINGKKVYVK